MYTIAVKIEGVEKRKRSAGLLHIVVGFFLIAKGADYYRYLGYKNFLPVLPFYALAIISLVYGFLRKRIDPEAKYNFRIRLLQVVSFLILGILLMDIGKSIDYIGCFIMSGIGTLLMFSEKKIFKETELLITEEGVIIPGDYKSHTVSWDVLSNVVVRHDFITLFHKNEKYLQYQVMQSLSELELAKMNGFCREKLEEESQKLDI